jgi:hypothetical protein
MLEITQELKFKFVDNIRVEDLYDYTKCWHWIGSNDGKGYGRLYLRKEGKTSVFIRAHKLSWLIHNPLMPIKHLNVLHKCDNPSCVNPDHLFLGTEADNAKDRDSKNRQAKGFKNGSAFLSDFEVKEIRRLYSTKLYTQKQLALAFKTSQTHVSRLVLNLNRIMV